MRCLGLAQEWAEGGGRVLFHLRKPWDAGFLAHAQKFPDIEILEAPEHPNEGTVETSISRWGNDKPIFVWDSYRVSGETLALTSKRGCRVVLFDDMADRANYPVDFIVNQNAHASSAMYDAKIKLPGTIALTGTRFIQLRKQFLEHVGWRRTVQKDVQNILVSLGGGPVMSSGFKLLRPAKASITLFLPF